MSEIDQLNAWLDQLDAIATDLARIDDAARSAEPGQECASSFEQVHRGALKVAGIVKERANAQRKRPLPLNVWRAIARCGGVHQARALEVEPFVRLRQRAEASTQHAAQISAADVRAHVAGTLAHMDAVRAELMGIAQPLAA
ncbi:MAG: hypothetical protein Q4G21_10905 [Dermabacter sp.]|nr:hypothetical protein [Dermabacter sp.]